MAFQFQLRLKEVPGFSDDDGLLSFHYCEQCGFEGHMAFGWNHTEDRGYDVRLIERVDGTTADELGSVAKSPLDPSSITFTEVSEIPAHFDWPRDLWARVPDDIYDPLPDDLAETLGYGLTHVSRSKVGGWPSWVQNPEWPSCPHHGKLVFVAQIDWDVGQDAAWANGGYAYLFACPSTCPERKAEFLLQTT
jgi:uncharacterized protein YwqG